MQAKPMPASDGLFTLPFAINHIAKGTLNSDIALQASEILLTDAKCILVSALDAMRTPSSLSTDTTLSLAVEAAASLLETAETITKIAEVQNA